ncbi:MAG: FHA domain-containing protein [Woeseia sp.]
MELSKAGIAEQPFRTHGQPLTFVHYQGQHAAAEFLRSVWQSPRGVGLLQGPPLSGKTAIIHHFVASLHEDTAVAVVDGRGLEALAMLDRIIREFGFELKLESVTEMMNLLRVYVMQQAAMHDAPLLIIENTQDLNPDALQVLNELSTIDVGEVSALRIVLSSNRDISDIVNAAGMTSIASRLMGTFNLLPMDDEESSRYVHSKLLAGGCGNPKKVLPDVVSMALHQASGGWPGVVDRLMALALARASRVPLKIDDIEKPVVPAMTGRGGLQLNQPQGIAISQAKLYLTYKGKTLREIPLNGERIMLGRTEHNDIAISSRFISRHHALFIRDANTTLLMDLNSTNGTFVNSRRISNHIMVHDDIINLGQHGLKFWDPSATESQPLHDVDVNDTIIMKNVEDMRRHIALENIRIAKIADDSA